MKTLSLCCAGLLAATMVLSGPARASVSAQDDDGRTVTLPAPARRIISLAPHTTELLYAAGAGPRIVATVRYADYPPEAKALPQVGDAHALDLERIVALKPDLIVVWMHGSSARQIERLRALKIPLFHSEAHRLEDVGEGIRRLGVLAGTEDVANAAANTYAQRVTSLRARYSQRTPLKVFYQVWQQPLLTLNKQHLISDAIRLCGGVNVFAQQTALVPTVSPEAVLAAQPQVLVAASVGGQPDDSLALWAPFKQFEPIARHHVVWLNTDLISRQGPRIVDGAQQLCEGLDKVRTDLAAKP